MSQSLQSPPLSNGSNGQQQQRRPSAVVLTGPNTFTAKPGVAQQSKPKPNPANANTGRLGIAKDPRDINKHGGIEDDHEEYIQRRKPLAFTFVVGLVLIAAGCPITWYGATRGLVDFLVIGPQAIIIGFAMDLVAVVMFGRDIFRMRRKAKVTEEEQEVKDIQLKKLMIEYELPDEPLDPLKMVAREPTTEDLYGLKDSSAHMLTPIGEDASWRLGSTQSGLNDTGLDDEIKKVYGSKVKSLPAPSLAYPAHTGGGGGGGIEGAAGPSVFTIPVKQAQVTTATAAIEGTSPGTSSIQTQGATNTDNTDSKQLQRKASTTKPPKPQRKESTANKLPTYDIPADADLDKPVRELTVTDLYGSPDATDFGSMSGVLTPDTGVTELDHVDDDLSDSIEAELQDIMAKDHAPPEIALVHGAAGNTKL